MLSERLLVGKGRIKLRSSYRHTEVSIYFMYEIVGSDTANLSEDYAYVISLI
jgi:hypothetical protein